MNRFFVRFRYVMFVLMMVLLLVGLTSAKRSCRKAPRRAPQMTSIHLVDRNGFTETISSKDRLKLFQQTDFLKAQPYQKVLRIFERSPLGNARSIITSYHPNGNLKQYLDVVNARANGWYGEWHANGMPSLLTTVIGGSADITSEAEKSWIYDGLSYVWNEQGNLLAEIQYCQGELSGISTYYHPSGHVWKYVPFDKGKLNGEELIYLESGDLFQKTTYVRGTKHGTAQRYWTSKQIASQEEFRQGRLENGQYFNGSGVLISEVVNGFGFRAIFGKDSVSELQEYKRGVLEGEVKVFNKDQRLVRAYHMKDELKHGEEIDYYDGLSEIPSPKLSVMWYQGKAQGTMKSWYPDGTLESQRELSNNAKNGVLTAWYSDGNLMMLEEYEKDKLLRGDYFRKGDKTPISQVQEGKGIAMTYDSEGMFIEKITYERGKPQEQ